jgi:hypothetical protein
MLLTRKSTGIGILTWISIPADIWFLNYQQRPAGLVCFYRDCDRYNKRCSWGFYLGEFDVPSGTGLLMGYLSMEYVFKVLRSGNCAARYLAIMKRALNIIINWGLKMKDGY